MNPAALLFPSLQPTHEFWSVEATIDLKPAQVLPGGVKETR